MVGGVWFSDFCLEVWVLGIACFGDLMVGA